jgi:hypothetical protein
LRLSSNSAAKDSLAAGVDFEGAAGEILAM